MRPFCRHYIYPPDRQEASVCWRHVCWKIHRLASLTPSQTRLREGWGSFLIMSRTPPSIGQGQGHPLLHQVAYQRWIIQGLHMHGCVGMHMIPARVVVTLVATRSPRKFSAGRRFPDADQHSFESLVLVGDSPTPTSTKRSPRKFNAGRRFAATRNCARGCLRSCHQRVCCSTAAFYVGWGGVASHRAGSQVTEQYSPAG